MLWVFVWFSFGVVLFYENILEELGEASLCCSGDGTLHSVKSKETEPKPDENFPCNTQCS